MEESGGGGGGGYRVVPDVIFKASTQMVATKDYVYAMVSGVVGDLQVSAGMAGDDSTAHSFASKYEPAARTIVQGVSSAGEAVGLTASKLLTMAATYLAAEDRVAARFTPGIDTSSFAKPPQPECEPQNAAAALPMVTESKQVNEIPIIGEFWPQGDPDRLRETADVWRRLATLIDDAQHNAEEHARPIPVQCSGDAITAFQAYVGKIWSPCPSNSDVVADDRPLMENLSAACLQMAKICPGYADAIDDCRDTLIAIGVGAGIITGIGVALTVFTFGGSDAAAAAGDAALAAEAAAAASALAAAEAELVAAAAIIEAEADGYRSTDGAAVDAKNVRNPGCSPRTLDNLSEGNFATKFMLTKDTAEIARYGGAIENPANKLTYLEVDTNDEECVGYWQFLAAANHVPNDVRYVP